MENDWKVKRIGEGRVGWNEGKESRRRKNGRMKYSLVEERKDKALGKADIIEESRVAEGNKE